MRNALPSKMLLAAVFSLTLLCAATSHAANATWNGTTDAVWATGTNWSATPVPGTGDIATFNNAGGAVDTIDLGAGVTINTILFDTASAAAYTIGNSNTQVLTWNNGGAFTMNSTVTQNEFIKGRVNFETAGGSYTITNNDAASSFLFSDVGATAFSGPGSGAGTSTLTVDAAVGGNFISVSIRGGIKDGTGNNVKLVKSGAGSLQISSSSGGNTYTGGTYLDAGSLLIVGNAGSLQSGTSLFIANGTMLASVNQGSGNYSNISQFWNGDWTFNDGTKGNNSLQQMTFNTGTVDLGATGTDTARTVTALSNTLTINSVISNGTNGFTTGLTKAGAGTMVLSGSNSFTGALSINAGTLNTTTLAAINTNSGIGKGSVGGSAADLVFGGGTLQYNSAAAASTNRLFTIGNASGLTATLDSSHGTAANTMSFTSTGSIAFGGSGARTLTLTGSNAGNNTFAPILGDGTGGATSLTKAGNGTWILTGQNTYSGLTTLTAGTLQIGVDPVGAITSSAIGTGNLLANGGGISSNSTTPRTIPNTLNFTSGDKTLTLGSTTNTGKLTFTGPVNLVTRTGSYGWNLSLNSEVEFAGVVGGANGRAFTSGTGTLILSNTGNNWSGTGFDGQLNAGGGSTGVTGFIRTAVSDVLSDTGQIGAGGNGIFDLNNNNDSVGGIQWQVQTTGQTAQITSKAGTLTLLANVTTDSNAFANKVISGNLSLGNATRTFNLGLSGNTVSQLIVSAPVSGTAAGAGITLNGTNITLFMADANTYTGVSTVNSGTMTFAKRAALYNDTTASWNTTNLSVAANATLGIGVGDSTAGYFGATDLNTLLDGSHLGASTPTTGLKTSSILGLDTSNATGGAFTYNSVITNPGTALTVGLTKLGSGALTLGGDNTYTGPTLVSQGTLVLSGNNSSASGATTVNSGATLRVGAANNISTGTLTLAGGTLDLRNDTGTNFAKNFTVNANSTINVDRAVGGSGTNNQHTMGTMSIGGQPLTVTGSNGYSLALGATTLTGPATFNPISANLSVALVTAFNQNLTLAGQQTSSAVGAITTGSGTLVKQQDSTWTMTGTSTYTGTTTINGGKLIVNGTKSGAGTVTVNNTGFLGGTGSIAGNVTMGNGLLNGSSVVPGGSINLVDGLVGTLTLTGTLTFSGTAANGSNPLLFDLGNGGGGTDKIAVTGVHSAANANGVRVYLNQLAGGAITPGTYTLIQGGSGGNTFTGYTLGTTAAGGNIYSALGASGNNLQVTVAAAAAGPASAFWKGGANPWTTATNWNTDAASNVALGAIPGVGTNVSFATTTPVATNLNTNTLSADFEINSLTVNSGIAATNIGGTHMLTIDASNANSNTAGNGITVNNAAGTTISTSRVGLGGSQTWTVGAGAALTVQSEISDFGNGYTLTKAGSGTLTLNRVSTYTGGTVVSGGNLILSAPFADYGTIRGALTINNTGKVTIGNTLGYNNPALSVSVININDGGTLDFTTNGNATFTGVTVNMMGGTWSRSAGNGIFDLFQIGTFPQGAINTLASATTSTISAPLSFRSYAPMFTVADGAAAVDLLVSGHLAQDGAFGLFKQGAGLMALTFNNSSTVTYSVGSRTGYIGATTINAGTLQLGDGGTTGNLNPASAIVNNGTLAFNRNNALTQGTDFNIQITGTGAVSQVGAGTTVLNGLNSYLGATSLANGILNIRNYTALGATSAGTIVASGATLQIQDTNVGAEALTLNGVGFGGQTGALVNVSGTNNYAGLVTLGSASTIASDAGTLNLTHTGTITGSGFGLTLTGAANGSVASIIGTGTGTVTKTGAGTWTLSGDNTYTGNTTISQGTLALLHATDDNIIDQSPIITIASPATLDVTGLNGGAGITIVGSQTLTGTGTVLGDLTMGVGSILSPGNTPGTLNNAGDVFWLDHTFAFEIDDATGTVGTDWDLLNITADGDLDLTGLTAGGLVLELYAQTTAMTNTPGALLNWNPSLNYAWTFARVDFDDNQNDDAILGFNAGDFSFDLTNFTNNNTVTGTFSVQLNGEELQIVYTAPVNAIPEPGTFALAALGLLGLGLLARRRRKA